MANAYQLARFSGNAQTASFPFSFTLYCILSIGAVALASGIVVANPWLAIIGFAFVGIFLLAWLLSEEAS